MDLVKIQSADHHILLVAAQNSGPLKIFRLGDASRIIPVNDTDVSAVIRYKNGVMQKQEFYFGASFLSQSGRFLQTTEDVQTIEIKDVTGRVRQVP